MLFPFLLSGCFLIKPSNPIPVDQDPKWSLNAGQVTCNAEDSCNDQQTTQNLSQHLADLKIGDRVWGLNLQSKEITQDHAAFLLTGTTKVTWTIKMYKDEETDEMLVAFTPENTAETISISDWKLSNYSIKLFEGKVAFGSFDAQTRQALLWGQELKVELDIIMSDDLNLSIIQLLRLMAIKLWKHKEKKSEENLPKESSCSVNIRKEEA